MLLLNDSLCCVHVVPLALEELGRGASGGARDGGWVASWYPAFWICTWAGITEAQQSTAQ